MTLPYMLAPDNPDVIVYVAGEYERWWIPRGHRLWDDYEIWLAEGNEPDPWTPVVFPRSEISE